MRYAIWYHLYNLKNVKNTHGGVLNHIKMRIMSLPNPLSANPTKWSNALKQFIGELPTNCLSVVDHFLGLAIKGSNVAPA